MCDLRIQSLKDDEAVIRRFRPPITLAPSALNEVPLIALTKFLTEHGLVLGQDLVIREREGG